MINSRAMPVPLTRSYQHVAGTIPQHAPAATLPTPCPGPHPGMLQASREPGKNGQIDHLTGPTPGMTWAR